MSRQGFDSPEEAEAAYYEAFEAGDHEAMSDIWSRAADVTCVHPGRPPILGRERVLQSYREILSATPGMDLQPEPLERQRGRDIAVHLLQEHIRLPGRRRANPPVAATNVYRREDDGWHMIAHHASPTAAPASAAEPRADGPVH